MASKFSLILCIFAIWAIDFPNASSTRNAPAPSADCSTVVLTMADCLSFVSNGSTITKPEGGCCNGLKTVLKTSPTCLCEALKSSAQFGVVLNVTKAVTLPAACNLASPPLSNCGLPGLPGAGAAAPGVSNSPPSPNAEAPSVTTPDPSTESADPPSVKSAASALNIPISAGAGSGSLLLCILSLFSGLC